MNKYDFFLFFLYTVQYIPNCVQGLESFIEIQFFN